MTIENEPSPYNPAGDLASHSRSQNTNLLRSLDNSVRAIRSTIRAAPNARDSSADLGCIIALIFLSPAIAFFTLILYLTYIVFYVDGAH